MATLANGLHNRGEVVVEQHEIRRRAGHVGAPLRTCRVGDCEVKLGEQALTRFRTEVDWKAPNARAAADA